MLRRSFLLKSASFALLPSASPTNADKLTSAARAQVGVTKTYDPNYTHIPYPNGDVPRSTGVCADVIIRAYRDALALDLQRLLHEDMAAHFAAYPNPWHTHSTDTSIDHRRVLNLEVFFARQGSQLWHASKPTAGNGFPSPLKPGDILTWRLNARWPHIGLVVADTLLSTRIVHNWGNGAEESSLLTFAPNRAIGHYRWQL